MTINNVNRSVQAIPLVFADDPEMAVEEALVQNAQSERSAARAERQAGAVARDAANAEQIDALHEQAAMHLVSGVLSGVSQVAQGAMTMGTAAADVRQQRATGEATDAERNRAAHPNEAATERQLETARMAQASATQNAGNWRGTAQVVDGAIKGATAGLDYAATAATTRATQAEQEAARARDRMQDAGDRATEAQQRAGRIAERMSATEGARAQGRQALITNLRG